jgi:hypothetical protein
MCFWLMHESFGYFHHSLANISTSGNGNFVEVLGVSVFGVRHLTMSIAFKGSSLKGDLFFLTSNKVYISLTPYLVIELFKC